MWIRITNIPVKQINAEQLENPKHPGIPMTLSLFQQEARSAFFVNLTKKVFPQYQETTGNTLIPRPWTEAMKAFSRQELERLPPQRGGFRLTIFGWIFFLFAFGLLGYLLYEGLQAPAKHEAFQREIAEKASVAEGDIYFGRYRIYKEKGNVLGSRGGFGWFKVLRIENGIYHIAKSVEISKTAKPKEQMNSTDFESEAAAVKAKELEAYAKRFVSEDGLTEFNLNEKKE